MDSKKAQAKFKYKLNNSIYEIDVECPLGTQILTNAGYNNPQDYDLILIKHGKDEIVLQDQAVCLTDPGVERFKARPKKVNDGYIGGTCPLPIKDINYLDKNFLNQWEFKKIDNYNVLFINDYKLPDGYNVTHVIMAIIIPAGYDSAPLDMAYFKPNLSKSNGRPIPNLTPMRFGDEIFQRWSRHRTNENPWLIGVDSIQTHIELINYFLRKEVER